MGFGELIVSKRAYPSAPKLRIAIGLDLGLSHFAVLAHSHKKLASTHKLASKYRVSEA